MAHDESFRIDLLGRFRISAGGELLREPVSSRGSELLALLLLQAGQPISRERIASRLWPESSEAQARTNLRRELHQLRRVLPQTEAAIDASGPHLAVRLDRIASDLYDLRRALLRAGAARSEGRKADELAALAEAAQQYAGDLFPECLTEWLDADLFWALEHAEDALRAFQELILTAPEELGGFFAFTTVPPVPPFPEALHGRKVSAAIWCFNGKQEAFDRIVKPLISAVPPLLHAPHELPFPALQSFFDPLYPAGLQWYWRADFFGKLPDAAIREHARRGATLPTGHSTMHLYPLNGAAARVGSSETAYRHREALWSQVIVGVDPSPAKADELRNWTVSYYDALHPYSTGGAYVNFMMEEGAERIRATYGANYERLQVVKKAYDADNFFRVNQNISPAR